MIQRGCVGAYDTQRPKIRGKCKWISENTQLNKDINWFTNYSTVPDYLYIKAKGNSVSVCVCVCVRPFFIETHTVQDIKTCFCTHNDTRPGQVLVKTRAKYV